MLSKRVVQARSKKAKNKAQKSKAVKSTGPSLCLYVNGRDFDFGVQCSFCEEKEAQLHCPSCTTRTDEGDFLCDGCDFEVHRHFKRLNHIRTNLPEFDADVACRRITGLLRFIKERRTVVAKCRERYERFFDPGTGKYYYSDMSRGTAITTWRKPYCLKSHELAPFPTFDDCAMRIQNCRRGKVARNLLVYLIRCYYERIFSREHTLMYYHYRGKSELVPRVQWSKPRFLFWRELRPVKNEDVAALMIQCQWHVFRARAFMRGLVRQRYSCRCDPLTGRHIYTNLFDHKQTLIKPYLLGSHDYDPEDVSLWDARTLCIWFRRLGFAYIVPELQKYRIDGALLLSFEWEDYLELGIEQHHRIKRILLEIERRDFFAKHRDRAITIVRRDRLRFHRKVERAALVLQRFFRVHLARITREKLMEAYRMARAEAAALQLRVGGDLWWNKKIAAKQRALPDMLSVPDKGKLYGKQRAYDSLEGFGCWLGDEYRPTDPTLRPRPIIDPPYRKPALPQLETRKLRFSSQRQNQAAKIGRENLHAKLLRQAEALNMAAASIAEGGNMAITNGES